MGGRVADPTFTYACWAAAVAVLLAFGSMALWLSRKHARDQDLQVGVAPTDAEWMSLVWFGGHGGL